MWFDFFEPEILVYNEIVGAGGIGNKLKFESLLPH